jgi:hypothetical protein
MKSAMGILAALFHAAHELHQRGGLARPRERDDPQAIGVGIERACGRGKRANALGLDRVESARVIYFTLRPALHRNVVCQ